jgi:hypothetical protein
MNTAEILSSIDQGIARLEQVKSILGGLVQRKGPAARQRRSPQVSSKRSLLRSEGN